MKFATAICVFVLLGLAAGQSGAQAQTPVSPDGTCPAGTHLQHADGTLGIVDPDTFAPGPVSWSEYHCEPNQLPSSLVCGTHGEAVAVGPTAACACAEGYAGDSCEVCATGYEITGATAPVCSAVAVNEDVVIVGADRVVSYGGSAVLTADSREAVAAGGSRPVDGAWRLDGDPAQVGCLQAIGGGACGATFTGSEVRYVPPAAGVALTAHDLVFVPQSGPSINVGVKNGPSGQIPVNGPVDSDLLPLVNKVLDFMRERCVGAGSLGVARHGKVVLALGLGMKHGRNAANIANPNCSSDLLDPFMAAAGEMTHDTPFMVGSVSKAAAYATARWTLKRALKERDVDVRVISQSPTRVTTASRVPSGHVRIDVWNLDATGQPTRSGGHQQDRARDFALVRMTDSRFVVVGRNRENKLTLDAYSIDANGDPQPTHSLLGVTDVKQVEMASIINQRIVVGLRRADDRLEVRSFKLEANGSLSLLDTELGGVARDIRLISLPTLARVVGAVRLDYPDVVKFIVWDVDAAGQLTRSHQTQLNDVFEQPRSFDMSALSSGKVIFAAEHADASAVSLSVLSVASGGGIALEGAAAFTFHGDVRVKALDPQRFVLATRDARQNGAVRQFVIDGQDEPLQLGGTLAAGEHFVAMDLGATSSAGWGTGFVTATRDSADALHLTSWDANTAALFKRKQGNGQLPVRDFGWSDGDIEALDLIGFDLPDALLPASLHKIVSGSQLPPLGLLDANDEQADEDGVVTNTSCAGATTPGVPFADLKWKSAKLRNFFGHRVGLDYGNIAETTLIKQHMGTLRGLTTAAEWKAQQDLLATQWGAQNVEDARAELGWLTTVDMADPDGFLVPPLSLEELLIGSASRCMPNAQGLYRYSNTDPLWIARIAEHVGRRPYTAPVGNPGAVEDTLLREFLDAELGIEVDEVGGQDGLFARPAALDGNGGDPFLGPSARIWDDNAVIPYYPTFTDVKRPHCEWNGGCVMKIQLNWDGVKQKVPQNLDATGAGTPTGALAMQIIPQLKFMSRFWSGGYDEAAPAGSYDPSIGEPRLGVWNKASGHGGALPGTRAIVKQFGAGCPQAAGVDLVISFNQWNDRECVKGDSSACATDAQRYDNISAWMTEAICEDIDWSKVKPVPLPAG